MTDKERYDYELRWYTRAYKLSLVLEAVILLSVFLVPEKFWKAILAILWASGCFLVMYLYNLKENKIIDMQNGNWTDDYNKTHPKKL